MIKGYIGLNSTWNSASLPHPPHHNQQFEKGAGLCTPLFRGLQIDLVSYFPDSCQLLYKILDFYYTVKINEYKPPYFQLTQVALKWVVFTHSLLQCIHCHYNTFCAPLPVANSGVGRHRTQGGKGLHPPPPHTHTHRHTHAHTHFAPVGLLS